MLLESIAIGLVYGFAYFELTGLVAGGLVAPGYFAVHFDQPWAIALCLVTATVTMLVVRSLAFITVLYGRRRFILNILTAFALQWTLSALAGEAIALHSQYDVVGFVIPGLVANEMDRQGVGLTLLSLLLLSGLVFVTLAGLGWLRAF